MAWPLTVQRGRDVWEENGVAVGLFTSTEWLPSVREDESAGEKHLGVGDTLELIQLYGPRIYALVDWSQ